MLSRKNSEDLRSDSSEWKSNNRPGNFGVGDPSFQRTHREENRDDATITPGLQNLGTFAASNTPAVNYPERDTMNAILDAAVEILRTCRRLTPDRQATLLLRDNLRYEQQGSQYKRDYFHESRQDFIKQVETSQANGKQVHVWDTLLTEDHRALSEQDAKLFKLEDDLSRKEFSMQSREKRLEEAATHFVSVIESSGLFQPGSLGLLAESRAVTTQPSLPSRPVSPVIDALLQDFYKKAGIFKIMRERLMEVDIEYRDIRTVRMLKQDQELPVEFSEDEFEERWRRHRAPYLQAYDDSYADVSDAKEACVGAGIDPGQTGFMEPMGTEDLSTRGPTPAITLGIASEEGPITPDATTDALADPVLGFRVHSSARLTTVTGNLDYETSLGEPEQDPAKVNERIEEWMRSSNTDEAMSTMEDDSSSAEIREQLGTPSHSPSREDFLIPDLDIDDIDWTIAATKPILNEAVPSSSQSSALLSKPKGNPNFRQDSPQEHHGTSSPG